MRIPFPERLPLARVALFAVALFVIQILEGTALYFSVGCVAFILIAALAFNVAGGLTRASGAYIFCYAVLVVIIGVCYKAFLGEPGQSNLLAPETDIKLYVCSVTGMFAAVLVSNRFRRKIGLLQNVLVDSSMYRAAVGCIVFGVAGGSAIALLGESGKFLQSAFNQLNQLLGLGMIMGVIYEVRRSGGTRSANIPVIFGALFVFTNGGIIYFSKQAMLLPFLCWLLPVCALRFRVTAWQAISFLVALFVIFHYLVPYSQYGRDQVTEKMSFSQRIAVSASLLEHPDRTRQIYNESVAADTGPKGLSAYYDSPQGFWERLQMISADDKLIDYTDQGNTFGLLPIKLGFINIVPHFLWPNKPGMNAGNAYAHELTGEAQGEGDVTTGISFSPTAEAYHLASWSGILVIAPLLWCMFFIVFDSLLGDLRATPWGLLAIALISHTAPEGGIVGTIYLCSFGVEILAFCAFFAAWLAPIFAIPVLGPDRKIQLSSVSFPTAFTTRIPR